jgi:hypothetical protein
LFMTVLSPFSPEDEFEQLREACRQHNTAKIKELLASLEPAVLGMMGPVNPGLVRVYLEALKQLGQLYRVFDRPAEKVEQVDEQVRMEVEAAERRQAVLAELAKLREIAEGRRG